MKQLVSFLMICTAVSVFAATGCRSLSDKSDRKPWSLSNLTDRTEKPKRSLPDEKYDVFGEANPDRLLMQDLGPGRIKTTLATRFNKGNNPKIAEKSFQEGQNLYDEAIRIWESDMESREAASKFRKASAKFEIAADNMRDSALEQDALFMQGESSFFANDYVMANRAYEILLNRYSGTSQLDLVEARRFEIAQYWLGMKRQGAGIAIADHTRPMTGLDKEARRILHRIRLDDPTGKLADDATLALGNAFMEAKRYSDAADTYEDLRRTYPGSQHQFLAHKFEIQARLAAYRGTTTTERMSSNPNRFSSPCSNSSRRNLERNRISWRNKALVSATCWPNVTGPLPATMKVGAKIVRPNITTTKLQGIMTTPSLRAMHVIE